jgi:hypothetical protein
MFKHLAIAAVAAASIAGSAHAQNRQWWIINTQSATCITPESMAGGIVHTPLDLANFMRQGGDLQKVDSNGAGTNQIVAITGKITEESSAKTFFFFTDLKTCLGGVNYLISKGSLQRPSDLQ